MAKTGYDRRNKEVLIHCLKTDSDGAEVMSFHKLVEYSRNANCSNVEICIKIYCIYNVLCGIHIHMQHKKYTPKCGITLFCNL